MDGTRGWGHLLPGRSKTQLRAASFLGQIQETFVSSEQPTEWGGLLRIPLQGGWTRGF